ncbi:MAG TPA: hypothetical protein VHR45_19490 [Thermoanaerobaculia bacterium]|nr:hypothetical protein [Thermoanaerobaculia bacterium]
MRELTKSILSFSWALPLFGIKQMTEMAMPRDMSRPLGPPTQGFDAVTAAAKGQLGGGVWQEAFKAGDQLQRGAVDMMFGWLSLEALNPSNMMRMTSDVMQRSVQAAGRMMPGSGGCGGCGGQGAAPGQAGTQGGGSGQPGSGQQAPHGRGPMPPTGA